MQPFSGNQRPDPEPVRWICLLYCACRAKCIFADPLQTSHACQLFKNCCETPTFCSLWARCRIPCASHTKAHPNLKKCPRMVCFVPFDFDMCFAPQLRALFQHRLPKVLQGYFLCKSTSKFASRHNAVHFFDSSTSKSAPNPSVFKTLDFEMWFAPQLRALFQHRNSQKCSEHEVFWAFWLQGVLRASPACNFSSLSWPDGSALAALASLLFDPPEPQIIGTNIMFRGFSTFRAPASFFFWRSLLWSSFFFSSLLWLFPPLLFHLCPYCWKFGF